jgi:hypothetical protein
MWRKKTGAVDPDLAGADPYAKQAPLRRVIPLWGGIGPGGFAKVAFHDRRKLSGEEWDKILKNNHLQKAVKKTQLKATSGRRLRVLCDNEGFMKGTPSTRKLYRANGVMTQHVPARSPDLNPVEKIWSWVQKNLLQKDLEDLRSKRPVPSKDAYKRRVLQVCESKKAKRVARSCFLGLPAVCRKVWKKKGAASGS